MVLITSASSTNSSPSKAETISRVISSVVGPRPPVTNKISDRANNSFSASPMTAPSGRVLCSLRRNEREMCIRHVAQQKLGTGGEKGDAHAKTFNVQRSTFNVQRKELGVSR